MKTNILIIFNENDYCFRKQVCVEHTIDETFVNVLSAAVYAAGVMGRKIVKARLDGQEYTVRCTKASVSTRFPMRVSVERCLSFERGYLINRAA